MSHETPAVQGTDEPILSVRDATVTFDMSRGESRVLDEVDVDVMREEVVGVVGESGSGKSMLANAILDSVVEPGQLSGNVTYYPPNGDPVDVLSLDDESLRRLRWAEISMVFQGAMGSFNPTMKIESHFEETLDAHDRDVDEGMEHARRLLSDLYLDADRVLDSYAHELSGGMKQRTLIALSLVLKPEVLIMDEPTAALDLLMQRSIINLLRDLKEEYDLTLLFITHDLPLVTRLADRLYVMYAFEIAEFGETQEILEHAAHPYTRMLLRSTPNLEAPIETMNSIEGSSPDPVNVPSGCSFHTRCPLADEVCESDEPPLHDVSDTHETACWYWEDAADAVPFEEEAATEGAVAPIDADRDATQGDPVVTLDDVRVTFELEGGLMDMFSEKDTVAAVDGVSLDIPENDVVAVVGESGCGKTTLGKAAIGLLRPTSGSVSYRGQDVWEARDGHGDATIPFEEIRQNLQIIHQDPASALNPNKRVLQTLAKPLKKWHSMSRNERESRIYTMLETVGMEPARDYAGRYPHQLSGGEKQRVALIRALLMNPALILADEAISALDVSLRVEMMDLMLELQDTFNTSFLFISHDLSNARYLAEKSDGRIAVMYLGEIVEVGPVDQIINDPKHPYTQVLRWATPDLREESSDESPLRKIDIPDPVNPPSGCRFHTRCPEAREVCQRVTPDDFETGEGQRVSCFRVLEDHEYWDSPPITDEDESSTPEPVTND